MSNIYLPDNTELTFDPTSINSEMVDNLHRFNEEQVREWNHPYNVHIRKMKQKETQASDVDAVQATPQLSDAESKEGTQSGDINEKKQAIEEPWFTRYDINDLDRLKTQYRDLTFKIQDIKLSGKDKIQPHGSPITLSDLELERKNLGQEIQRLDTQQPQTVMAEPKFTDIATDGKGNRMGIIPDPEYMKQSQRQWAKDMFESGMPIEEIEAELGGLEIPVYDPIDLAVDVVTGFQYSVVRGTANKFFKGLKAGDAALAKQAGKTMLQDIATDIGYGGAAGTFMAIADEATDSGFVQVMSGILGTTMTSVFLTMGRKGFAQGMKTLKQRYPKKHRQMLSAIEDNQSSKVAQEMKSSIEEPEIKTPFKDSELNSKVDDTAKTLEQENIAYWTDAVEGGRSYEVKIAPEETYRTYLDLEHRLPPPDKAININLHKLASSDDIKAEITKFGKMYQDSLNRGNLEKVLGNEKAWPFKEGELVGRGVGDHQDVMAEQFEFIRKLWIDDQKAVQEFLDEIYGAFKKQFAVKPDLSFTGRTMKRTTGTANPGTGRIRLHNNGATVSVLIHELAHLWKGARSHDKHFKAAQSRMLHWFAGKTTTGRMGTQTWQETIDMAQQHSVVPKLLGLKPGEMLNAQELFGARLVLESSADKIRQQAIKLRDMDNVGMTSKVEEMKFRKMLAIHQDIQNGLSGAIRESGRALNSLKIQTGNPGRYIDEINEVMSMLPGKYSTKKIAEMISTMDSAQGINKIVRKGNRVTGWDMMYEIWINGILSGPITHAKNVAGNSLNAMYQVAERFGAATWSQILGSGEVSFREPWIMLKSMRAIPEGISQFGKVMKSGDYSFGSKTEISPIRATTAENYRRTIAGRVTGHIPVLGKVIEKGVDYMGVGYNYVGRTLAAEDVFFKTIGYRMELNALAHRQALKEGLSGNAYRNRIADILQDPGHMAPDIAKASEHFAKYITFTNELGEFGQAASRILSYPGLNIIVPFKRTPANIFKYSWERFPVLNLLNKDLRTALSGPAGAAKDQAVAKMGASMMFLLAGTGLVMDDRITGGGPKDQKKRRALYETGWQPYSVRVGDKYYSYKNIEPFGTILGVIAQTGDIMKYADDYSDAEESWTMAIPILHNFMDKAWMVNLAEFFEVAMSDSQYKWERFGNRIASSIVPAIVGQTNRAYFDKAKREYDNWQDAMISKIPGLSDQLPPQKTFWGEDIEYGDPLGPNMFSFIYTSEKKYIPINDAMLNIGYVPEMPSKKMSIAGVDTELKQREYNQFLELMNSIEIEDGKNLKESLNTLVTTEPAKTFLEKGVRTDWLKGQIQKRISIAKKRAKQELYNANEPLKLWLEKERQRLDFQQEQEDLLIDKESLGEIEQLESERAVLADSISNIDKLL